MKADFLLVSDDNYVKNLGISTYSILHNMCGEAEKVRIFVMDCGISEENLKRLRTQTARFANAEMFFLDVASQVKEIARGMDSTWHPSIYGRLVAAEVRELCPDVTRLVYMDCDTLMDKPVTELFTMDMDGKCLAAVADADEDKRKIALGMPAEGVYINSGVLVIDLSVWAERNAAERIIGYILRHGSSLRYPDQDAISAVMWDDMKLISLTYNMMWMICDSDIPKLVRNISQFPYSADEVRHALHHMHICHYSGHDMWTFYGITPVQARIFKKYRRLCDWRDERRSFETPLKLLLWLLKTAKRLILGDFRR